MSRTYDPEYYRTHREQVLAINRRYKEKHPEIEEWRRDWSRRRSRWFLRFIQTLKEAQGCSRCGTHKGMLDYHHLDPTTKTCNVSNMYSRSLEVLYDEIAKCTVLCAPCHGSLHRNAYLGRDQ